MPRPNTKKDLMKTANCQFAKMWELIDGMNEQEQNSAFTFDPETAGKEDHWKRDKNIRDVLIHLYEWHELLLRWINANQAGEVQPFLPSPYNWKSYGEMNRAFFEKHSLTPYTYSRQLVNNSHKQVVALIESFTNDELFEKKRFEWVGGSTLGSYCVSVTASHYDWAIKKIKKHIKTL